MGITYLNLKTKYRCAHCRTPFFPPNKPAAVIILIIEKNIWATAEGLSARNLEAQIEGTDASQNTEEQIYNLKATS